MYEVTIGIPLYNAGKYIRKTMEVALEQSFRSIEYLIIDDCGTDNSMEIIKELQEKHPRGKDIRIVAHEKNKGVAAARNSILKESTGKYLFFLDSDDFITPDCIEKLYNAARENDAEVVYASYKEKWENRSDEGTDFKLPHQVFTKEDELATFANQNLHQTLRSFVWNVLYNLAFLRSNKATFQPVRVWEDLLFYYDIVPLVKRAVLLSDVTYVYVKREGSLSQYHSRDTIPVTEILEHIEIREYCKKQCMELTGKPYFANLITKTMKICLDTAGVAVEKRKFFVPRLSSSEIKKLLRHPLTFSQISKLQAYKLFNRGIFLLGKSPAWVSINTLALYIWILKMYRKRR